MKKLISIGLVAMVCGVGFSAGAQTGGTGVHKSLPTKDGVASKDGMPTKDAAVMQGDMTMGMKTMDANGDGMVSKAEYDKYHATVWKKMKRDKKGMVTMDDMFSANGGKYK